MANNSAASKTRLCDGGKPGCKGVLRGLEARCTVCAPSPRGAVAWTDGDTFAMSPSPFDATDATTRRLEELRVRPTKDAPAGHRIGCRTFSATLKLSREALGDQATAFLRSLRDAGGVVTDRFVVQSSDEGWHCLSIVLFYTAPVGARL